MAQTPDVAAHYRHGRLVDAIREGLTATGISPENAGIDDLAAVDEFHIGGRAATTRFLDHVGFRTDQHLLDIGCGLGGTSRWVTQRFGCRVTGIDLTDEFVAAADALTSWVGLGERVGFHCGSALDMPFDDAAFDGAFMLHVGMNIRDKDALFAEVARVLRPGSTLAVYDVMRTGDGELTFPVPWSTQPTTSAVHSPEDYVAGLTGHGFAVEQLCNRRDFALGFFEELRDKVSRAGGPPAFGMHIVMGSDAATKVANMIGNIERGLVAPFEIVARLSTAQE